MAWIGWPFCCTCTNITRVFICMQIGVGLDAGAVRTRSKTSQVSPVACVYVYMLRITTGPGAYKV